MRLTLLITGLLALKPSPDAPDKDLYTGIGLSSHRSPKIYYHNSPFNQTIFLALLFLISILKSIGN